MHAHGSLFDFLSPAMSFPHAFCAASSASSVALGAAVFLHAEFNVAATGDQTTVTFGMLGRGMALSTEPRSYPPPLV